MSLKPLLYFALCFAGISLCGNALAATITTDNLIVNPGVEAPLAGAWGFTSDDPATENFYRTTSDIGIYAPNDTYQFRTTVKSDDHHWALAYQDIILPAEYTITQDTLINWGTSLRMSGGTGVHREMQASVIFYTAGYQQNLGSDIYYFYQWPERAPANAIANISQTLAIPEATKIIRLQVLAYKGTYATAIYGFDDSFVILEGVDAPDPINPVPEPISLMLLSASVASIGLKKYLQK